MTDPIRTGRIEKVTQAIAKSLVELTEGGREATLEQLRTYQSVVLLVTTDLPFNQRSDKPHGETRRTFVVDHEGSFHRMADN